MTTKLYTVDILSRIAAALEKANELKALEMTLRAPSFQPQISEVLND